MKYCIGLLLICFCLVSVAQNKDSRYFEMRTYHCNENKRPDLIKRFQDHTLALFEKHGMKNEMYWTPLGTDRANQLIYVVSHESEEAAKKSWAAFRADPDWIKARDASEADGKIVEKVESVMMKAADFFGKK